jgi:hypothetical protein
MGVRKHLGYRIQHLPYRYGVHRISFWNEKFITSVPEDWFCGNIRLSQAYRFTVSQAPVSE